MNIKITSKYFILLIVCAAKTTAITNHLIHDIGYRLCPYTSFCHRNATPYDIPILRRPCCSECSCEANCGETANCCPDQDIIDNKEPTPECRITVVKKADGFSRETRGYQVIDYCPTIEKNASLVTKCTTEDTRDFQDIIWVSDDISGKIYRNKFCAECHRVTSNVTEWQLEVKCTEDIYTYFDSLKSFFLSDKCQLTSRQPDTTSFKSCAVPKYTTCNQTGLWPKFDADVNWACQIFEAAFFTRELQGRDTNQLDVYKNAYCYVCNVDSIQNTETLCPMPGYYPSDLGVFTSLIDYKSYQQIDEQESQTTCRSYEIMDEIMVGTPFNIQIYSFGQYNRYFKQRVFLFVFSSPEPLGSYR